MSDRYFQLRLHACYTDSMNKIDELVIEVLHDDEWEVLQLGIRSPGFLLFINGLFSCQHLYMRTNAAEHDVVLDHARGEMKVRTSHNWVIQDVAVDFEAAVKSGGVTEQVHAYIIERMHHCPVSTNLPAHLQPKIGVRFVEAVA